MTMTIEQIVLHTLTKDREYAKKVRPHLDARYFGDGVEKVAYELIEEFYAKYGVPPPRDAILIELENLERLPEKIHDTAIGYIGELYSCESDVHPEWLLTETEKFCRDSAIHNAIMDSVKIINGESKEPPGAIPSKLSDALGICFDVQVGHDYFDDISARYDGYHEKNVRFPTRLEILNKVTDGGLPTKSLCVLLAQSGGGKSAVKCSLAADWIRDGHDVLYITMELSEQRVAERIDANLLNIPISDLKTLSREQYTTKMQALKAKSQGRFFVKEYPTGSATVDHFNALMEELAQKKGFKPKIVIVDYLQICSSARFRGNSSMNTYQLQKYVSEELRGFAVKHDCLLLTSIQTNRSGFNVSDFDESSIADSAGILFTADFLLGIIRTDELKENRQVLFKQIKNRFGDPSYYQKFLCGMDTSRMKVYDIEETITTAQKPALGQANPSAPQFVPDDMKSMAPTKKKSAKLDDWDFGD